MKKVIILIIFVAILTIGCSKNDQQKKTIDYGQPVKVTVAWNDIVYVVTNEHASKDNIGNKIGQIKRQVSPEPSENGDVARNTSEGPNIVNGDGSLYEVKGLDQKEKIAVELSKDEYLICDYLHKLVKNK